MSMTSVTVPTGALAVGLSVALALGAAVLATVVVAFSVVRPALRRARRRMVEETRGALAGVRARALPPGPRQEAAQLRWRLRRDVRATARLLEGAEGSRDPVGDLPGWARRLERVAMALDQELLHLDQEPDQDRLAIELSSLRRQVDEVCEAGGALRATLRQVTTATWLTECAEATAGLHQELNAVHAGALAYLQGPPPGTGPAAASDTPSVRATHHRRDQR